MKVKVNGRTITIFAGARVTDVLLRYSRPDWDQVLAHKMRVTDRCGHEVSLDGELSSGDELFVVACPPGEGRP